METQWVPASGLPNGRWRVTRNRTSAERAKGAGSIEELETASGRRRTFQSFESARAVADKLNGNNYCI
jgi:hypothetical protein